MATHDVDKKILGRLGEMADTVNAELGRALFTLLGLSEMLSRRLLKARRHRKARSTSQEAIAVYHHVVWMSREGLAIVEHYFPQVEAESRFPPELRVFFYKLRASFYHVFVLFHNNPRISLTAPSRSTSKVTLPLSPSSGNGNEKKPAPPPKDDPAGENVDRTRSQTASPLRARGVLRDPVTSMLSEESAITNPWGAVSPPPGLGPRPGLQPAPDPAAFLLPSANYLSMASGSFATAHSIAMALLPGSAPLRLSVCLEYCAFLWDCQHDHDACRKLASETINYVWEATEGMEDDAFEDSAQLVGTLGRMMRRRSQEGTPKIGPGSPANPGMRGDMAYTDENPPPPLPKDDVLLKKPTTRNAVPAARSPISDNSSRDPPMAHLSVPRKALGSPATPKERGSPAGSPSAISRKPVGSGPSAKRTASPVNPGSPAKRSSPPRGGTKTSGLPLPKRTSSKSPRANRN